MWGIARNIFAARPRALVQHQLVRHHAPICGPPRHQMPVMQKLIIGGGMALISMIIPFYCLFQVPRWSAAHRGIPYEKDEEAKRAKEEAAAAAEAAHEMEQREQPVEVEKIEKQEQEKEQEQK